MDLSSIQTLNLIENEREKEKKREREKEKKREREKERNKQSQKFLIVTRYRDVYLVSK